MLIKDPRIDAQIDVTGWDLDALAETLTGLRQDIQAGSVRELTDAEWDAVTDPPYGLEIGSAYRYADEAEVIKATIRLGEIVDEAIFQRDLPGAMDAKVNGREMTGPEAAAWDTYMREIIARS